MRSAEALESALAMLKRPQLARLALGSSLPRGVTLLLEVAAGESEALDEARALTGRSAASLQKAAGFFIEQVLLHRPGDSYRILGAAHDTPTADLRRHMALIMKWLHPDLVSHRASNGNFDRSVYVNRVTQAWETLKSSERRTAYDNSLAAQFAPRGKKREADFLGRSSRARPAGAGGLPRVRQFALYRLQRDGLLSRFMIFLRGLR